MLCLRRQGRSRCRQSTKSIKAEETAILLVNFQANFVSPDGAWYGKFAEHYAKTRMLERTVELVSRPARKGCWWSTSPRATRRTIASSIPANPGLFHRGQIGRGAWKIGSKEAAYYAPLKPGPEDRDLFLPPRSQASGFGGTGLNEILRSKGIKNVAVAGFTSDVCVYATVLSAYDLGFHVYALREGMVGFFDAIAEQMVNSYLPDVVAGRRPRRVRKNGRSDAGRPAQGGGQLTDSVAAAHAGPIPAATRGRTMSDLIRRRTFVAGSLVSIAVVRHASAAPPAVIADGTPIGRGKLLVVHEDASGRIVALDSSSYLDPHPTGPTDVIVVGSYCGTRILAPMFSRGVKAVIATDAGIGKDDAGISGLKHGETIGVPVATIAVMSAETSNGRSTLLGEISRANAQARALGVAPGMVAYEAAARLAIASSGKPIATPLGAEEAPVVVEETAGGRIWATPGTTAIKAQIPNDVICSGANSSRVFSDGVLRIAAKGASPTTRASPRTIPASKGSNCWANAASRRPRPRPCRRVSARV